MTRRPRVMAACPARWRTGRPASERMPFYRSRCLMLKRLPFHLDPSQFNVCLDQFRKRSQDFTLSDASATAWSPFYQQLCLQNTGFLPLPPPSRSPSPRPVPRLLQMDFEYNGNLQ